LKLRENGGFATIDIDLGPRRTLGLVPVGLLAGAIWRIATFRDYSFKSHATRSLQQLEAIIEAF
jgi:hypothetical protein